MKTLNEYFNSLPDPVFAIRSRLFPSVPERRVSGCSHAVPRIYRSYTAGTAILGPRNIAAVSVKTGTEHGNGLCVREQMKKN